MVVDTTNDQSESLFRRLSYKHLTTDKYIDIFLYLQTQVQSQVQAHVQASGTPVQDQVKHAATKTCPPPAPPLSNPFCYLFLCPASMVSDNTR